jgi:DNA-directed RNA polymerase subunit RPC12/RpoP
MSGGMEATAKLFAAMYKCPDCGYECSSIHTNPRCGYCFANGKKIYMQTVKQDNTGMFFAEAEAVIKKHEALKANLVNHPPHYQSHPSGIECITITRHMNFNLGNAIKYIWRAGEKDNQILDLEKAIWYLTDEIARLKAQEKS